MHKAFVIVLLIIFSSLAYANCSADNFSIVNVPTEPAIDNFSAGAQKIYIIAATDWNIYTDIIITTNDFNFNDGINTKATPAIPILNFDINGSTQGLKQYIVTFSDGNPANDCNRTISFIVDTVPGDIIGPLITTDFNFNKVYNGDVNIIFNWSDAGVGEILIGEESVDGSAWQAYTSGTNLLLTFDGNKQIDINAVDVLGNSTIGTYFVYIDRNNPTMDYLASSVNGQTVRLDFNATDSGAGVKGYFVSKDGNNWTYTDNNYFTENPGNGTHTYYVKAVDFADNNSLDKNVENVVVAYTPPAVPSDGSTIAGAPRTPVVEEDEEIEEEVEEGGEEIADEEVEEGNEEETETEATEETTEQAISPATGLFGLPVEMEGYAIGGIGIAFIVIIIGIVLFTQKGKLKTKKGKK